MKTVLVTGGVGFIGANFIRLLLKNSDDITVYNLDKLTYAGDNKRLREVESDKRYHFIRDDISNGNVVKGIFSKGVDTVVHFAAESHVDRSITDAFPFERTNVRGTLTLLDASRESGIERFIHISTDEVYGEIKEGQFFENTPLNPNSPYSASKAAGDHFVKAYIHTYGLPAVIVRPSNNYGPWQYPEKLIPVVISNAMSNKPVPVYARGFNVREWLYVEDCAEAVLQVMKSGRPGEVYNVGSGQEAVNINVVKKILSILGKPESLITYVKDRPGHDFRYSLNSEKIKKETGWKPRTGFDEGLEKTVKWYLENEAWWRKFTL
ncbi:MAG: dTDP-glucose 4,6-dehydratase [Deltaproteobacteria bacterium]